MERGHRLFPYPALVWRGYSLPNFTPSNPQIPQLQTTSDAPGGQVHVYPVAKYKNGLLARLASNPLVTIPILELWAKWVKSCTSFDMNATHLKRGLLYNNTFVVCCPKTAINVFIIFTRFNTCNFAIHRKLWFPSFPLIRIVSLLDCTHLSTPTEVARYGFYRRLSVCFSARYLKNRCSSNFK